MNYRNKNKQGYIDVIEWNTIHACWFNYVGMAIWRTTSNGIEKTVPCNDQYEARQPKCPLYDFSLLLTSTTKCQILCILDLSIMQYFQVFASGLWVIFDNIQYNTANTLLPFLISHIMILARLEQHGHKPTRIYCQMKCDNDNTGRCHRCQTGLQVRRQQ